DQRLPRPPAARRRAACAPPTRPTPAGRSPCRPAAPSTWPPPCAELRAEQPEPHLRRRRRPGRRVAAAVGAVPRRADDRVAERAWAWSSTAVGNHEFDNGARRTAAAAATAAATRRRLPRPGSRFEGARLPVPGGQHGRHAPPARRCCRPYAVKRFQRRAGRPSSALTLQGTPGIVMPAGVARLALPRRGARPSTRWCPSCARQGVEAIVAADARRRRRRSGGYDDCRATRAAPIVDIVTRARPGGRRRRQRPHAPRLQLPHRRPPRHQRRHVRHAW
ncbi:MAG: hypothetical protein MZW92_04685, partial [Comamonadaceae bacterium]|nr:hypothetical protein [Comamonadaceae bacterium]